MLNRVFVPRDDPGSWLGWALLLIGLASAALVYLVATGRGRWRPSIASGALYGALCWLVAGAILMPILGLLSPLAATTAPAALTPPDPMHGSFMMLNVGIAAPIAALIAWLMLGTMLGASSPTQAGDPSARQLVSSRAGQASIGIVAVLIVGLVLVRLNASPPGPSETGIQTLATEPMQALPAGTDFFSAIELSQAPGGTLGPHAHPYSGFAYSLKGVATIAFLAGTTTRVAPQQVGFIGLQAAHSHENTDDVLPSAILALSIVALALLVCLIWYRRPPRGGRLILFGLGLVIVAGGAGMLNPGQNDWLFFSVRAISNRGAPMPLATASRTYESANVGPILPGKYVETIQEITVAPSGVVSTVGSAGSALLFVLDGQVGVQPAGGSSISLGAHGATVLQPGASAGITNAASHSAHLILFSTAPMAAGS